MHRILTRHPIYTSVHSTAACSDNIVVGPVNIPCSGQSTAMGQTFTFGSTSCGMNDLMGWAGYVEAYALQVSTEQRPVHRLLWRCRSDALVRQNVLVNEGQLASCCLPCATQSTQSHTPPTPVPTTLVCVAQHLLPALHSQAGRGVALSYMPQMRSRRQHRKHMLDASILQLCA
jgi:hypothetical protein